MTEPIVFPGSAPTVSMRYRSGREVFDAAGLRCGLMVAPTTTEKGSGMIVCMMGDQRDVLLMALAAMDAADRFGVGEVLRSLVERGLTAHDAANVIREEWHIE